MPAITSTLVAISVKKEVTFHLTIEKRKMTYNNSLAALANNTKASFDGVLILTFSIYAWADSLLSTWEGLFNSSLDDGDWVWGFLPAQLLSTPIIKTALIKVLNDNKKLVWLTSEKSIRFRLGL